MKKIFASIAAFAACLLSISCQKEEDPVVEGQYTEFQLSITTPAPTDVTMTKATDQQETQVDNLMLLFYKDKKYSSPRVVKINNLGTPQKVAGSETNYIYTVTIKSEDSGVETPLTSGDWYLFAVANYNRLGFGNINIDEFQTLPLEKAQDWYVSRINPGAADLNMNEAALLMTGFYGRADGKVTLKQKTSPTDNTVQKLDERVHLRRITSKISLNFKTRSNDVKFTPSSYSIYNYPTLSQTFENQGWTTRDGAVDNVSGTFPGASVRNIVAYDSQVKNILNMPFNGSATFYMYENVQRPASTDCDTYEKRELRYAGDYGQFVHAPQFGTYVVVKGYYEGPISPSSSQRVTGDVTYTIHLGDFSSATGSNDNFTIRRNAKYNYNVTVNGVNSIYVEATTYAENQPGAEGNLIAQPITTDLEVDAHYVTTMVMIRKDFIRNSEGTKYPLSVITKTPKDDVRVVEIGVDNSISSLGQDVNWIHFIKPANSTTFVAYPGTGATSMTDIYGLVSDLRTQGKHFYYESASAGKTDFYYVQAFIDEYVYEDLPISRYVNAPSRELVLQHGAFVSADGHSSYIDQGAISLRQKSIKSMYDLNNSSSDYHPFGIESVEETTGALQLNHVNDISYHTKGASSSNGYANSREMVTTLSTSWATLYNSSKATAASLTLNSTKTNGVARYACLQRNRDENGDGVIDDNEMKWYLPARDQAMAIIFGQKALGDAYPNTHLDTGDNLQEHEGVWYWTSSVSPAGTMYNPVERTLSFPQHGVIEGENKVKIGGTAAIRCARTLNGYDAEPASFIEWNEGERKMSISNLNHVCVRNPITGEYLPHTQKDVVNALPESFVVARNLLMLEGAFGTSTERRFTSDEMKTGNWCQNYYSESADGSDLGSWRIPNQSEIFAMMRFMNFQEFVTYDSKGALVGHNGTGCRTQMYLSKPGVGGHNYQTVFHISYNSSYGELNQSSNYNLTKDSKPSTNVPWYRIRCVRDANVTAVNSGAAGSNASSSTAANGGVSTF